MLVSLRCSSRNPPRVIATDTAGRRLGCRVGIRNIRVPPTTQDLSVSLSNISSALMREQSLLEMLLFKLEEEHLLLAAGRTRWLVAATREIEAVLSEIRRCELVRATLVEAEAPKLGLGRNPSLRELAEYSPEPWDHVIGQHRASFLAIADEISAQANDNELLARASAATRNLFERAAQERSSTTRNGETAYLRGSVAVIDMPRSQTEGGAA